MKKQEIRRHYRLVRRLLLQQNKPLIEEAIMRQILAIIKQVPSQNIAIFFPKSDEFSLLSLKEKLPDTNFLLPRTRPENRVLDFYLTSLEQQALELHPQYKIYEPYAHNKKMRPDVILVPLLAFDTKLHRIGYGGGYYDATIAHLKQLGHNFVTIGVAHSALEVSEIIADDTDMALDYIATENLVFSSQ